MSEHDINSIRLSREARRIIEALSLGGPQDLYQLTEPGEDIHQVHTALDELVEKELVQERKDCFRLDPTDPATRVFGIPLNSK